MWIYEQATGRLLTPDISHIATGYAGGNEGKNPEGKNNPDMQCIPDVGPLPRGIYYMQEPVEHRLGLFAIPLLPDKNNDMCGRGGFYCHGDKISDPGNGSEGCIVMPNEIRHKMWDSIDHVIAVVHG
jgi:hypothetical protein